MKKGQIMKKATLKITIEAEYEYNPYFYPALQPTEALEHDITNLKKDPKYWGSLFKHNLNIKGEVLNEEEVGFIENH
jgi:hypothetical protein